jgi:hypothetical protein
VDHALTVSRSLARAAHDRYDLTLDQAAAVAEDDEEAVKALVAATKTDRFDHVLATARQKRSDAQARAEISAQIEALGVRVTEDSGWPSPARALDRLTTGDDEPLTETSHGDCPGHVAWADEAYVCVLPDGTVVDEDDDAISDEQYEAATSESRWLIVCGCDNPSLYGHKVDGYLRPVASVAAGDRQQQGLGHRDRGPRPVGHRPPRRPQVATEGHRRVHGRGAAARSPRPVRWPVRGHPARVAPRR